MKNNKDFEELDEKFNGCVCNDETAPVNADDNKEPERSWNLITAFNQVLMAVHDCHAEFNRTKKDNSALDYLKERLSMTAIQIAVIAMLIDEGAAMTWRGMAKFLGISRLSMMTYSDDVEDLVYNRRWLRNAAVRERMARYDGFALEPGVIRALRHNELYVPEKLDGFDEQEFVDRMAASVNSFYDDSDMRGEDEEQWLMNLVSKNPHLPLCKEVMSLEGDIHNKCLLLILVADYATCADSTKEGIGVREINSMFPDDWQCQRMRKRLMAGEHELMEKGWVDFLCDDGMADVLSYVLTEKAKTELLGDYEPTAQSPRSSKRKDPDLISCKDIQKKDLYYNVKEQTVVDRLRKMLSQEQFPQVQRRLKEEGMRTGVAVLLNGGPGTGKTELVRQLSRETGRDMLMIDVSQVKDKFVGESEKNTKAIFDRYKRLCRDCRDHQHPTKATLPNWGGAGGEATQHPIPILFINECDAILGKRMENVTHGADKMLNTMQNILLQCIEDFDGILICTTNLAEKGLDQAFMRRFLVKAEFTKPDADVRAHIWQTMLPSLSDDDAHTLAERYDFSGGQCENVKRKATIEHVINGTDINLDILCEFCQEETVISQQQRSPIKGFA